MPIYEFLCRDCNTIYKFFSRTVNTSKVPACPRCGAASLTRVMSVFSVPKKGREGSDAAPDVPDFDEARMEKAMAMLEREADAINEDDPRQAADLMRKLSDAAGLSLGPGMEEALARLERGEDPEKIEAEMGDILENEDPFLMGGRGRPGLRTKRPQVDDTLYEL